MYGVVEPQCLSPLQHVSVLGRYAGALSAVPVEQKQAGDVVLHGLASSNVVNLWLLQSRN